MTSLQRLFGLHAACLRCRRRTAVCALCGTASSSIPGGLKTPARICSATVLHHMHAGPLHPWHTSAISWQHSQTGMYKAAMLVGWLTRSCSSQREIGMEGEAVHGV